MFKIMISFHSELEDKFGVSPFKTQEFYVGSPTDVCTIICRLSHLKLLFTLQEISVGNADSVLKNFEVKEV